MSSALRLERRLAGLVLGLVVWLGAPADARAALFFLFEPTSVEAGGWVSVRTAGTPAGFGDGQRALPVRQPIRLYLVPNRVAPEIRNRFDTRLHFVGNLVPDARGRGVLRFRAPPLDSGRYAISAWCPGCARYSDRGRTFSVLAVDNQIVPRYRARMALRVRTTTADGRCPSTLPDSENGSVYDNGLLSVPVDSSGAGLGQRQPDGSIFDKLGWIPVDGVVGQLSVRGERLDHRSPPLEVLGVNWGNSSSGKGSWASAVRFPTEGCWRLTGRVRDISLTYVVSMLGT